jgi:NAD(P)-dependent dehydrogenase (short-subunit alcohol dehydrogenase family)
MEVTMSWRGKTALVTGAGEGLGRATALELARRGANLVVLARRRDVLLRTAAEVEALGGRVRVIAADIADKDATYAIAAQAQLDGPLDLLVQNASTLGPVPLRLLLDTTCEDLLRVLEVNLVGPFRLSRAIAGAMIVRGSGVVLQVSSDAATSAYPRWGAYGASKAALEQLGRVWDAELTGTGVRVLSFDPGEMDTAMHAAAMPDADRAALPSPDVAAQKLIALAESHLWGGARP